MLYYLFLNETGGEKSRKLHKVTTKENHQLNGQFMELLKLKLWKLYRYSEKCLQYNKESCNQNYSCAVIKNTPMVEDCKGI